MKSFKELKEVKVTKAKRQKETSEISEAARSTNRAIAEARLITAKRIAATLGVMTTLNA